MAVRKTRAQWAAEVRAAHKQSIDGILKMGRTLIAAKDALAHGEFAKMIERDLPFDASTAQRLMKIARDPRIRNAARVQLLPMAWGALYELTKLPDEAFEKAVASGAINPQMRRDDAAKLVAVTTEYDKPSPPRTIDAKVTYQTLRLAPAAAIGSKGDASFRGGLKTYEPPIAAPDELEENPEASLALSQMERLVRDLSAAVQCGDVLVDVMLERRVRDLSDRLLSLLTLQRHVAH
jgi:DUF3102 family protein